MNTANNVDLFGNPVEENPKKAKTTAEKTKKSLANDDSLPEKLGKAVRLPVPDFNDPDRKPTCLEVDFPIAQINALSNLEGNAGKPIYQMSKWWARRRSSVFRSMLIAAATEAPDDPSEAAKKVWEHYYCNHQKAGSFKQLRVLDCFMGGGTTLVEGSRLGMQMTGVDLNPVAWFVVKNELACSDPEQVKALFDHIEQEVKPQIQPFYITTCPRGHKGKWIDIATGAIADVEPIDLPPEERKKYRWEGPEVIYTFWAKHGPCQAKGCNHRTPIFRSPVIAEKNLTTNYIPLSCPGCGLAFHAELGETRMAPGVQRVVHQDEMPFTEMAQEFAMLLNYYEKGGLRATVERAEKLKAQLKTEAALSCPKCSTFSGKPIENVLAKHLADDYSFDRKKKAFGIEKKKVQMFLLIHPEWLKGSGGFDDDGVELGGFAGASADATTKWNEKRLRELNIIEVRGNNLPEIIEISKDVNIFSAIGTIPEESAFRCGICGRISDITEAERQIEHHSPVACYSLQCFCPECENLGYNYGGRFFSVPSKTDILRYTKAEAEWEQQKETILKDYWPHSILPFAWETHVQKGNLTKRGYTHWWKMFNARQLLVHSTLLKSITDADPNCWALDVKEQILGAFQQYLRNQNMFCFWDIGYDKLVPFMSNANYHPKMQVVENSVFSKLGRGNWLSAEESCVEGTRWAGDPYEVVVCNDGSKAKSIKLKTMDPLIIGSEITCGSSTDLSILGDSSLFDLVITDPPFGNNVYYADLADFFYVWLRLPLLKWYADLPEYNYFNSEFTPKTLQAIDDPAQHPDNRKEYEKVKYVKKKHLSIIKQMTGNDALEEKDLNPLYLPPPSGEFYCSILSSCWAEAGRLLKDGGIMSFTFHHNDDSAWIDVLQALFEAGFYLISTYPVRSDETKGDAANAAFGSKKIEYDIIHVCRKRLSSPEPVSWARMRRWVKEESKRLKDLLENTHAKELPEPDLRIILRGKSLEFYSRHYGQVYSGDGQILAVRDALLGINQLLDDLLEDTSQTGGIRPPDIAEPASRLYLRLFHTRTEMDRDELHKTLRGSGISQGDLEALGWIRTVGRVIHVIPVAERFAFFTAPGRNRRVIKTDLDQAHFLIGAAHPKSGLKIDTELDNQNFRIKKAVDEILKWYAVTSSSEEIKTTAQIASQIVEHWRNRRKEEKAEAVQLSLFEQLENEE